MMGFGWILTILVGGLAGWIAEKLMKFDTGLLMNIVLGIAGAVVGNAILGLLGIFVFSIIGQLIVAVLGACIVIWAYRAFKGGSAA